MNATVEEAPTIVREYAFAWRDDYCVAIIARNHHKPTRL